MALTTRLILISTCLLTITALSQAGTLYRFKNENGVMEISRSLPPDRAQAGYEILDDKNFSVIDSVPAALNAEQLSLHREQEKQHQLLQQQQVYSQEQERDYDRRILATYPDEAALIRARDSEIGYRQQQIQLQQAKLPAAQTQLEQAQQAAAESELNGQPISSNTQKRLESAQQAVASRQQAIALYQQEIEALNAAYEKALNRFRELQTDPLNQ